MIVVLFGGHWGRRNQLWKSLPRVQCLTLSRTELQQTVQVLKVILRCSMHGGTKDATGFEALLGFKCCDRDARDEVCHQQRPKTFVDLMRGLEDQMIEAI